MTVLDPSCKPQPWPKTIAWHGQELQQETTWVTELDHEELSELRKAINSPQSNTSSLAKLHHLDFDIPKLRKRALTLRHQLHEGAGFALIRGLHQSGWDDASLIRACWILGSLIGNPVPQNARADLLGHVIDRRTDLSTSTRLYQTNKAQPFHSDSCDIVSLMCLRPAKSGGESALASSAAIHNKLLMENAELLQTLYGEFQCDRYNEIPEGKQPTYPVHVFNKVAEKLVCCGMDPDIRSAQRLNNIAPLTQLQSMALDAFQAAAHELSLGMMLERGDIQLANNLTVVHARRSFEDHAEADKRRHLIRLWLSAPEGRQLPEFLSERWGNIRPGEIRGGIRVAGATPTVNFEP